MEGMIPRAISYIFKQMEIGEVGRGCVRLCIRWLMHVLWVVDFWC